MASSQRPVGGLPVQAFSANPLDRLNDARKAPGFLAAALPLARFLLLAQGKPALHAAGALPRWFSHAELVALGADPSGPALEPLLLGRGAAGPDDFYFALDVSALAELRAAVAPPGGPVAFTALRDAAFSDSALARDAEAMSIVGQAVALVNWHAGARFCGACGAPTRAVEAGGKRVCAGEHAQKAYPRTDPVVIMLVESPDGARAILGRYHRSPKGLYTALAGFVEQAESVEAAVRREVMEESGVAVEDVRIWGTQPWPIGRFGACELMVACVATARTEAITVEKTEMEDVRWFSRAEVAAAVAAATRAGASMAADAPDLGLRIPGQNAVAYHLIRAWVEGAPAAAAGRQPAAGASLL